MEAGHGEGRAYILKFRDLLIYKSDSYGHTNSPWKITQH